MVDGWLYVVIFFASIEKNGWLYVFILQYMMSIDEFYTSFMTMEEAILLKRK